MYSLVIINYGTPELILKLLDSLVHLNEPEALKEVIIVDNGYPDKLHTEEIIKKIKLRYPIIRIPNREHSYASGVNVGVGASSQPFVVVSNSDVEFIPGYDPYNVVKYLERIDELGMVGVQQVYPSGKWQRCYGTIPGRKWALQNLFLFEQVNSLFLMRTMGKQKIKFLKPEQYLDGAFLIIRRRCFDDLQGFDVNFPLYCEETDFSYRAQQKGWKLAFYPQVRIQHIRGGSTEPKKIMQQTKRIHQAKVDFILKHFPNQLRGFIRCSEISLLMRIALYLVLYVGKPRLFRRLLGNAKMNWTVITGGRQK